MSPLPVTFLKVKLAEYSVYGTQQGAAQGPLVTIIGGVDQEELGQDGPRLAQGVQCTGQGCIAGKTPHVGVRPHQRAVRSKALGQVVQ